MGTFVQYKMSDYLHITNILQPKLHYDEMYNAEIRVRKGKSGNKTLKNSFEPETSARKSRKTLT